jgi:hypothetical protein
MNGNTQRVRERIIVALTPAEISPAPASDIAFLMTDWDHNLADLMKVYDMSQELDNGRVSEIVIEFLAHVPNHVAAARKLIGIGPIEDTFDVGVLKEDGE